MVSNHEYNCLTLEREKTYNIADAEVAQVVEQRTEKDKRRSWQNTSDHT
jgi:hypothetical protein